ncbi:MAG: S-layer homology domain-containing protein [Syntrophomonadaceae bacterium]|nr:S-layer homology domain-containing protein [Syntrophomonadaceae bacterium]
MKRLLVYVLMMGLLLPGSAVLAANGPDPGQGDMDRTRLRTMLQDQVFLDEAAIIRQRDRDRISFPDTVNHWAQSHIANAFGWGLVAGYPDGNFGPERYVSGIEAVIILDNFARCLNGLNLGTASGATINWEQVPVWARTRLQESTAMQIALQSQFYGEAQVNRLQVATTLAKMLGLQPLEPDAGQLVFQDQNRIPSEQLGYILALKNAGIIAGNGGNFEPMRLVTRAEITTMLMQIIDNLD